MKSKRTGGPTTCKALTSASWGLVRCDKHARHEGKHANGEGVWSDRVARHAPDYRLGFRRGYLRATRDMLAIVEAGGDEQYRTPSLLKLIGQAELALEYHRQVCEGCGDCRPAKKARKR